MSGPGGPNPPPPVARAPVIGQDLPCWHCGYNLRGLTPDRTCPECGLAIERTLNQDLIRADPAWLRRVARGAALLKVGLLLLLLACLCLLPAALSTRVFNDHPLAGVVTCLLPLVPIFILLAGCLWFTSPETDRWAPDPYPTQEPLRRVAVAAAVLLPTSSALLAAAAVLRQADWPLEVMMVAAWLSLGVVALVSGVHAQQLARRMGRKRLRIVARIVTWANVLFVAVTAALAVMLLLEESVFGQPAEASLMTLCAGPPLGLISLAVIAQYSSALGDELALNLSPYDVPERDAAGRTGQFPPYSWP
jgi:hypothetical protein